MKKFMMISMIFSAVLLVTPAWSHHPAEGIVSDEIWQMVDDLLVDADSPHLDIDFSESMDAVGSSTLASSVIVNDSEVVDFIDAIDIAIDDLSGNNRVMDGDPASDGNQAANENSDLSIVIVPLDNDMTEITILEPVGSSSMTVPSDVPAATGKGAR